MAKKPNAQRLAWQEAARERIRVVVDKKYQGNQSELANALGVARSLMSIVLRKVQPPTKNLMARLGTIPGINPRWASEGEGVPFGPDTSGTLPIALGVLPAWPERCPELLSGERLPAAEAYIRPSRYWCRVEPTCPALKAVELALLVNDILLMDANAAMWADRLSECVGKLFGVRVRRDAQASYQLALLRRNSSGLVFDVFTENYRLVVPSPSPSLPPAPVALLPVGVRARRKVRSLKPVETDSMAAHEAKTPVAAQLTSLSDVPFVTSADIVQTITITPEDVIAVRVGLYRS